jgi:hypothetical protein
MSIIDSSSGVIGGCFGAYALAQGSDTLWLLDSLYSTILVTESYGDSTIIMLSFGAFAYISDNRGLTWSWVSGIPTSIYEDIQFINRDTIYTISHQGSGNPESYFSYSFNGGLSWNTITLQPNIDDTTNYGTYFDTRIYSFYFDTSNHGFIVGFNYDLNESVIFETNDYGQNWTVFHTGFNEIFYSLLYVNDSTAFIGGSNGLLLKWNPSLPLNPVGITENVSSDISFYLFPNPANDLVTIKYLAKNKNAFIVISNILGEEIVTVKSTSQNTIIPIGNLSDGVYFVSIRNKNQTSSKKLIIQH